MTSFLFCKKILSGELVRIRLSQAGLSGKKALILPFHIDFAQNLKKILLKADQTIINQTNCNSPFSIIDKICLVRNSILLSHLAFILFHNVTIYTAFNKYNSSVNGIAMYAIVVFICCYHVSLKANVFVHLPRTESNSARKLFNLSLVSCKTRELPHP